MSFKSAVKTIGDGIKDLSQLNVVTFTGQVAADVGGTAEEAIAGARVSGNAKLVGATTINLDGDVSQFITNDPDIGEKLHAAHFNAVSAGQSSRNSALDMFRSAISNAVKGININPNDD